MKILPFDLERDFELYFEGDSEAFTQSFPGITINQEIRKSIESGIRGLEFSDEVTALTLFDDKPVGFVVVSIRWFYTLPQGHIESIFVHASKRGSGGSKLLIDAAKNWSFSRGAKTISLEASIGNEVAIEAYKSAGFVVTRLQMEGYCAL